MKCIPYLQTGDTVVIVTPAKKIEESYITKAIQLLESWGLHVEVGAHALGSHYYFSGTDAERAEDMQWALDHPTAKAIICARGGYGSVRIIEELNYKTFTKNPKWVVGFSDITIFHNYIHSRLHLPSKRSEYGSIKPGVQNDTFKLEQLVATLAHARHH